MFGFFSLFSEVILFFVGFIAAKFSICFMLFLYSFCAFVGPPGEGFFSELSLILVFGIVLLLISKSAFTNFSLLLFVVSLSLKFMYRCLAYT